MLVMNGTEVDVLFMYKQKQRLMRQTIRKDACWASQTVFCLLTFSTS